MNALKPERTILLVEDNPDDEALTLRALKKNHILNEVRVARDGAEALACLEEDGPLPTVVLLDLKLPKLSGLEVLAKIRNTPRTAQLPVVIFTSSNEERDLVEGYNLGVNSYVQKPVDFAAFVEAAKTLGMYWLLLNEPCPMRPEPQPMD